MDLGLSDRVAVVTGGSEGIGKATAVSLAAEGANVIILARTQSKLDSALEEIRSTAVGEVESISCNVTERVTVDRTFDRILRKWGKIDILINNAGYGNANSFNALNDELLGDDLKLKVYGAVYCSQAVLPSMRKGRWGRIINITTAAGKAASGSSVPTSMSRAAGIAMTKAMSKEYAADNVLVNTVCIGSIKSGQNDRHWEAMVAEGSKLTLDEYYANNGKGIPLGRVGEAREAGDLICFLASERASYISGTAINMDGGAAPVV
ncbi:MAG: 3-oxoacyl-[acyl-carrier-protein] reductase FabG [Candidatus Moanabacter tarae]|uniref:3-oxoacyl-[acyl-carrier-protein] reductase FabG n=1 Tax=Candidatus Moanibacter tarae TaxID=2200854 RepID=A0A2Z4AGB4_9BACT|nr:MAG: 3-oxoacyl-[acyl-carrier-protein] reductase FabG [Candidatus Moanabacter tarae]|tara:strand:+ start:1419 stop:2210 length:792 start_codon:yes stop_codon:yes gene_type:complete